LAFDLERYKVKIIFVSPILLSLILSLSASSPCPLLPREKGVKSQYVRNLSPSLLGEGFRERQKI
jgi:hypothetical protein